MHFLHKFPNDSADGFSEEEWIPKVMLRAIYFLEGNKNVARSETETGDKNGMGHKKGVVKVT